jgi:hypothetical protein
MALYQALRAGGPGGSELLVDRRGADSEFLSHLVDRSLEKLLPVLIDKSLRASAAPESLPNQLAAGRVPTLFAQRIPDQVRDPAVVVLGDREREYGGLAA